MTLGEWHRVKTPNLLDRANPGTAAWQREVIDGHLSVFVSPSYGEGRHISISHRTADLRPGRYPSWDEIVEARYRFGPDEATMAMLLPPRAEYVNIHNTTFHLWEIDR